MIPCLDVRGGRLVKGINFESLRDCGDPVDAAERYAADGADEIVWLNISAGDESWPALLRAVERAAETGRRAAVRGRRRLEPSSRPASCCWPAPTRSASTPPRSTGPR